MYIVTGGAGFIGCWIVSELNKRGIKDILIVDRLRKAGKYRNLIGLEFEDFIDKTDFLTKIQGDHFSFKVKAVFHMGACSSTTEFNADYLMRNNYQYSKDVALWSKSKDARLIYASSAATYGDGKQGYSDQSEILGLKPLNPYGYSKYVFDLWAHKNGFLNEIVGLKFFNVYGPNEAHKGDMRSVVKKAHEQILDKEEVSLFKSHNEHYKDGDQLRDFIYVKDVIDIILFFLDHPEINGIYNVGTGQARSFNDLVKATFLAMDKKPNINFIDMPLELRPKYQYFTQADTNKLRGSGYVADFTSIEAGVADYVKNYLSYT
ncbi:MAG: ADP-glyceromanno-heptose 6-epimerase [Deltaproteobacteria bacterium]|nr:ADP-glyceromanno-heptose 6-epimerase [Deltaproteobacteria bacterium]